MKLQHITSATTVLLASIAGRSYSVEQLESKSDNGNTSKEARKAFKELNACKRIVALAKKDQLAIGQMVQPATTMLQEARNLRDEMIAATNEATSGKSVTDADKTADKGSQLAHAHKTVQTIETFLATWNAFKADREEKRRNLKLQNELQTVVG